MILPAAKRLTVLVITVLMLSLSLLPNFPAVVTALAQDNQAYIVAEEWHNVLSRITPDGKRTVVYKFDDGTLPVWVAVDSAGDYIVTEQGTSVISEITASPAHVRSLIFTFPPSQGGQTAGPSGLAIDSAGNYIVTQYMADKISKVSFAGSETTIYTLGGSGFLGVATEPWHPSPPVVPQMIFQPSCGPPGTTVSLVGSGFPAPPSGVVGIYQSPRDFLALGYCGGGQNGDWHFSCSATILSVAPGRYMMKVVFLYPDQVFVSVRATFDVGECYAVGGVVVPVNTFAIVAPWLAVIGLVGCVTALAVVAKKR